jgi:hypothetical protein
MTGLLGGCAATFLLGFFYFVGAIPAGFAAGVPVWLAAVAAWLGYAAGAAVILVAGTPARDWVARKLGIPQVRDPQKWIWKVWARFGLIGLGLVAPVTIGPQIGALLALAVGERPMKTFLSLSLGVLPWCVGFAAAIELPRRFFAALL